MDVRRVGAGLVLGEVRPHRGDGQSVDALREERRLLDVLQHVLRDLVGELVTRLLDLVLLGICTVIDGHDVELHVDGGLLVPLTDECSRDDGAYDQRHDEHDDETQQTLSCCVQDVPFRMV